MVSADNNPNHAPRGRGLRPVVGLVVTLLALAGCTPIIEPKGTQPPAVVTSPAIGNYDIYFNVEVLSVPDAAGNRRPKYVPVIITVEVLQADGQYAEFYNPTTGERGRKPFTETRSTPVHHGVTFGPGTNHASAAFTAIFAGFSGEAIQCWVERNGVELPKSRVVDVADQTVSGRGGGKVVCHYIPVG